MQINRLRIGQKLVLVLGLAILVSFLIAGIIVGRIGNHYANDTASDSAETINGQVINMVEVFASELEHSADLLIGSLGLGYPDRFRLDESATTRVGERTVPALYSGQRPVSLDYGFIDRLTAQTKSVATIFARDGNDFVRITTSLKKEDGARAVGTVLDQKHPAYAKLIAGESYRGMAKLFGRSYFTKYQPIKEGNRVIGVLFVGVDFTDALAKLREQIKSVRLGETGYVFVVNANAADKEYGNFVVHPTLEGKSALEVQDARGKFMVKEMLEKKKGEVRYLWQRPNTSGASESLAVVAMFPEFDWMVATRADISELSRSVNAVQWAMLVVGLVLLIALPLLVFVAVRRLVTTPLGELRNFCAEIERSKDFTLRPPQHGEDEVGQTTDSVTRLLKVLRQTFTDLLEDIHKVDEASRSMSSTARETARNSGQASDSASAMAASVEELSVGINHIASSANEAAELSRDAGLRSQEGGKTILDATAEMNAIADKVRHTSSAITSLGEESRQISGIVAVIKEVAEQT
ncbi:MAG: methyl-accepting chemotaxis protein, partial [Betaproteobacteria bacterium]